VALLQGKTSYIDLQNSHYSSAKVALFTDIPKIRFVLDSESTRKYQNLRKLFFSFFSELKDIIFGIKNTQKTLFTLNAL
jgi:hypothetical protein